ncbi:SIR2 family protein [Niveispirillum sp. SYP-B3756]|uniref:SIR2 family protein n=1 Tax=Niveispirillum sp. SYP-B3756 TaxID=2662178 RepID=UPI0015639CB5|nr:SIR2 family protein [Niveispirillum sp. SYP-B3756]
MPSIIEDGTLRLAFSIQQQPGVYALLLGSGLSSAAGIPTGWGITIDLIRQIGTLKGETTDRTDADWEGWYRAQTDQAPDYSALLAALGRQPSERQPIIARYIEPSDEDRAEGLKVPTLAHHAIARLVAGGYIRVILTTNFDRLLETALRDAGVEPVVIASPDQCNGARPLQHVPAGSCTVVKLHGDYLDVRSLNTAEELATYDASMEGLLARVFDEYGLVICGWSGVWDTALRQALLRAPGRRYSTWWASLGPLAAPAQDLARHRDAQLVTIDGADGFFCRLADQVELIHQARRPPPASVELLIAAAKRYLSKPEFRIELSDLLDAEASRALTVSSNSPLTALPVNGIPARRHQIERYEAAFQPLASIAGVIGRWGNDEADQAVLAVIRHLYNLKPGSGGTNDDYRIKTYPALLVCASYALGLIAAQRWTALWQLFQFPLAQLRGTFLPIAKCLFLNAWEGSALTEWWQSLELEDRKSVIPLVVRLWTLLETWAKQFLGPVASFPTIMGRYELLGALAICSEMPTTTLEAALIAPRGTGGIGFPVGKIGWDCSQRRELMNAMIKEINLWPNAAIDQRWLEAFKQLYERQAEDWRRG